VNDSAHLLRNFGTEISRRGRFNRSVSAPTVRQIYALAAAVCERMGEEFPETREAASATIERLRIENGHPAPRLEDSQPRPRRRYRGGADKLASMIARRLAEELR
jgi:hypothetical protein